MFEDAVDGKLTNLDYKLRVYFRKSTIKKSNE